MRAFLALIILLAAGAGGQQGGSLSPLSPAVQRVYEDLRNDPATTNELLARDIATLTQGRLNAGNRGLGKLVDDLVKGLSGTTMKVGFARNAAEDLETALNPEGGSAQQTSGAVSDFSHQLQSGGMDAGQAELIRADLVKILPTLPVAAVSDAPAHKFRFSLQEATNYDKFVMVEDFESRADIFQTWYQPKWSTGIVTAYDSTYKCSGRSGLTISNTQPSEKGSSMAKIPKPYQDIEGMNAIRMWIKPFNLDGAKGSVSTGFIDGTDQIWQVDLPGMLSGTEPYILQVRLADFRRVLRRNTGRIKLVNHDFAFWMTGTYKFTVDDIMFVHDPALPEFVPGDPR